MTSASPPLVTFALFAYNQEKFIREAVESAFSQTYSPLEIILSDDNSQDLTFEIMREMAVGYQGKHRIVLNRNEKNLGLSSHISKVLDLSKGCLIVMAAGDDVSKSNRVERLYHTWFCNDKGAVSIYSSAIQIDSDGNKCHTTYDYDKPCHPSGLQDVFRLETAHVVGSTQAISRVLWDKFGGMIDGCHEDEILPFRALLMDGIYFVPEQLVYYRTHETNFWSRTVTPSPIESLKRLEYIYRNKVAIRKQWLADYLKITSIGSEHESELKNLITIAEHQLSVIQSSALGAVWRICKFTLKTGSPRGINILIYKTKLKWKALLSNEFDVTRNEQQNKIGAPLNLSATVAICTYNGASRVCDVLEALALQSLDYAKWEILVIDNASTDETLDVCEAFFEKNKHMQGRVVRELYPGLSYARARATREARGEILCFLDDDNIPDSDFVDAVLRAFHERPQAGVIGGRVIPRWQKEPTPLASAVANFALAICDFGENAKQINDLGGGIVGAGLCIQTKLLRQVFESTTLSKTVTDRTGSSLISGGDLAISIVARQLGWECWYDPNLKLEHIISAGRMDLQYLKRLYEGIGRGQAATRKIYDWKARTPLNWLIGLKDLCRWKLAEWRGASEELQKNYHPALAADLHTLNQMLTLGRAKEALKPFITQ